MSTSALLTGAGAWVCIGLVLIGALVVVVIPNLFRAALSLGVVLLGVAGLFVLLEAEFVGLVQVLVYVGAILTLVVFAIMLIPPSGTSQSQLVPTAKRREVLGANATSTGRIPAALFSLVLFFLLSETSGSLAKRAASPAPEAVPLDVLGWELITTLLLPFEVMSLVFVAALVGAVVVAHTGRPQTPSSKWPRTP